MLCISSSATNWWLRSSNNTTNFYYVNSSGNVNNNNANNSNGVVFGSCPVRQSNPRGRNPNSGIEGEHDRPLRVNKRPDRSGRTLLAWRRLMVMRRFMPGDLTRLSQPSGKPCGLYLRKATN